ncbi:unnamed protein product, partial [Linum tenue]
LFLSSSCLLYLCRYTLWFSSPFYLLFLPLVVLVDGYCLFWCSCLSSFILIGRHRTFLALYLSHEVSSINHVKCISLSSRLKLWGFSG